MTARSALPLVYGLCDEWTARRQLIGAVGGEPDQMAEAFDGPTGSGPADPGARQAEIAALFAAAQ